MPLILPNDFVNGSLADAVPVEQNYSIIEGYVNTELISRDGAVAMQAPLMLVGNPSQDNHAANKDYVDALLPVGIMVPWPAPSAPAGNWHLCDGASLATSTYPTLFGVLGYRYGGSGASFLLPKTTGRVLMGFDASRTEFNTVGKAGGTFTVPVPSHAHTMSHNHTMPHTHEHPHTHTINHDHGTASTTAPVSGHTHDLSVDRNSAIGAGNGLLASNASGTHVTLATGNDATTHVHQLNMPSYSGSSGAASDATSGQPSAASTGAVSTPNTGTTGTAGVEMIPVFVVVNYIIRMI